ncbi:hypothetical protein AS034_16085 [[Bacillus] enclensis]|nr:hypothetical protein AS034_16085 [[Bacillus] enclensis]
MGYHYFSHKKIFEENLYPWELLRELPSYIERYLQQEKELIGTMNFLGPKIIVGKNVTIEEGAFIKGPAIIGDDVQIRHGAYIRENVIIGDNCKIGHCSEIKHSLIVNGSNVPHFNYIGDSIIGKEVNFGAGSICSNYKNLPYGSEINITAEGGTISTGLTHFGAVVGDGSKIGCNTVLNPGTILGRGVVTYSNLSLRGIIEAGHLIKSPDIEGKVVIR